MPQSSINFSSAEDAREVLQNATLCLLQNADRIGCTHQLPDKGQVFVTGDLHDNPFHLTKIIKSADLHKSSNHLVLQELIHSGDDSNRLDMSYRMLIRVASLVCSYPSQVHPILANHELSQATGRAITKGGGELVHKFNLGVHHVFGKHADRVTESLNAFMLSMPLAVQSKSGLMCLHSLPNELMMEDFDPSVLERELTPRDIQGNGGSAYMIVWGRQHTQEQVNQLAERWGVKLFCLGHAWVPGGIDIQFPNVLALNSDHNNGVVLPIQLSCIEKAGKTMQSSMRLESISLTQDDV